MTTGHFWSFTDLVFLGEASHASDALPKSAR